MKACDLDVMLAQITYSILDVLLLWNPYISQYIFMLNRQ
jgi:hypothetical protein